MTISRGSGLKNLVQMLHSKPGVHIHSPKSLKLGGKTAKANLEREQKMNSTAWRGIIFCVSTRNAKTPFSSLKNSQGPSIFACKCCLKTMCKPCDFWKIPKLTGRFPNFCALFLDFECVFVFLGKKRAPETTVLRQMTQHKPAVSFH